MKLFCTNCTAYNVCKYADKRDPDMCPHYLFRSRALKDIMRECERQDEKWGEQNHPMLEKSLDIMDSDPVPSKEVLENRLRHCRLRISIRKNWFDILLEEICEAFLETEPEKQREEMVQVAAVAVQIIEYLDRHMEENR